MQDEGQISPDDAQYEPAGGVSRLLSAVGSVGIRTRIVVHALLPLLVLAWLAAIVVGHQYRVMTEMRALDSLAGVAIQYSAAVHELQKERGVSAGFLGSAGRKFAPQLTEQRRLVDVQLDRLRTMLEDTGLKSYSPGFTAMGQRTSAGLVTLPETRDNVSNSAVGALEAMSLYSETIADMLGVIGQLAALSNDGKITNAIAAYIDLMNIKELAGQERAIGAAGFATGNFNSGHHLRFVEVVAAQNAYLDRFRTFATREHVAFFDQTLRGRGVEEAARMRNIVLRSGDSGAVSRIDGAFWFEAMSSKIEQLKTAEDRVAEDLRKMAGGLARTAKTRFINTAVVTLLASALTFAAVIIIVNSITRPLTEMAGAMGRLANYDLDVDIPGTHLNDEIGTLAAAAEVFRDSVANLDLMRRRLQRTQDNALDAIITIDENGAVVEFNPSAEALFGYRLEDVRGKDVADLIIPPSLRGSHREGISRHLAAKDSPIIGRRLEMTALRADGSEFPMEIAVTAVDVPEGTQFTAFLRDITDRKNAEAKLTRALADQAIIGSILGMSLQPIRLEDILRQILSLVLAHGDVDPATGGAILLVDPATRGLVATVHTHVDDATLAACATLPLGSGVVACGTRSPCRVMIGDEGAAQGMIVLFPPAGAAIADSEREFCTAIADSLAGIIARHRAIFAPKEGLEERRTGRGTASRA
ncbi:MAG: nitrate- and nitrite sensing domain-containing protein [Alphaproteobacteria bacterium]